LISSDLPQVPSRWNAGQPRCYMCAHLRIDGSVRNVYANAWCSLMPSFGFFNVHFAACFRFEASPLYSRNRNDCAKNAQRNSNA